MKKIYTKTYWDTLAAFALIIAIIVLNVSDGFAAAGSVRSECLRLHILAASDSYEDQSVKLLVRDRLLETGAEIFSGAVSAAEAAEKIMENRELLIAAANGVLQENGFSYTADIIIEEEYFETRQYEDVKLPAGVYLACKVVLGEGKGQNWWCVMFPPLCLPAATKKNTEEVYAIFGEDGGALVTGKSGYKIKFRIVELAEEIIRSIEKRINSD